MRVDAGSRGRRFQKLLCLALLPWLGACQYLFGDFSEEQVIEVGPPGGSGGDLGAPGTCIEGTASCDGPDLYVCSSQGFPSFQETCGTPERCDDSGAGRCLVCVEDEFECVDAQNSRRCEDGQWVDQPECSGKLRCSETAEQCVACDPGDGVCVGDVLCTCLENQTGWDARTCLRGCEDAGVSDRCIDNLAMSGAPVSACSGI